MLFIHLNKDRLMTDVTTTVMFQLSLGFLPLKTSQTCRHMRNGEYNQI